MQFLTVTTVRVGHEGGHGLRKPALITHPAFQKVNLNQYENEIYFQKGPRVIETNPLA